MHTFLFEEKKIILTKLQHFCTLKFYSFWLKHCGNFVYSFEGCSLNLCRDVSDILKHCIRFDIIFFFYKIMAFSNLGIIQVLTST